MKIIDCINRCSFLKLFSFISSMFPLSIYLMLSNWNNNYNILRIKNFTPKIICIFLFILEIVSIFYVKIFYSYSLKAISKYKSKKVILENPIQEKVNTSDYLLSNVLPIITLNFKDNSMVIFTIILIFTLGFMYIKNDLYYINPLYDVLDIKVYDCNVIFENNPIPKKKIVISNINLYDFKNRSFLIYENTDIIFVVREV